MVEANRETLYWTIGGVALALLALYAISRSSSGSAASTTTTTGGGGVNASALTSQVNTVNADAAKVEETLLNDVTSYATYSTGARSSAFAQQLNSADTQLAAIEAAGTSRYATSIAGAASEYAAGLNALTAEQAQAQATQRTNIQTSNAVTAERVQAGAQKTSSIFGFLSSIASAFTGGIGGLFGGGAYSVPASSQQQPYPVTDPYSAITNAPAPTYSSAVP